MLIICEIHIPVLPCDYSTLQCFFLFLFFIKKIISIKRVIRFDSQTFYRRDKPEQVFAVTGIVLLKQERQFMGNTGSSKIIQLRYS